MLATKIRKRGTARKRSEPMPDHVELMLCTLVDEPFDDPEWLFEPKLDGLRVICRFDGRQVTLTAGLPIPRHR